MKRTVKMHLLKDHMVKCMDVNTPSRLWLNGRAGAESIHAKFKLKLKSIMKEHYLNVPPHMDQLQYRGQ